jgi:hypothetical protein
VYTRPPPPQAPETSAIAAITAARARCLSAARSLFINFLPLRVRSPNRPLGEVVLSSPPRAGRSARMIIFLRMDTPPSGFSVRTGSRHDWSAGTVQPRGRTTDRSGERAHPCARRSARPSTSTPFRRLLAASASAAG